VYTSSARGDDLADGKDTRQLSKVDVSMNGIELPAEAGTAGAGRIRPHAAAGAPR
jgi:hypothetical protein